MRRMISAMSDKELRLALDAIVREQAIRRKLDASPEKIENAISEYQKATGKGEGEQWAQPTGPLNAYRKGAVVEYDGEEWRSLIPHNPHKPGVAGWRLEPTLDEDGNEIPPRFVRPSSAADAYGPGDRITWTDGKVYEAQRVGVDWDPDTVPQDWKLVEPEPEPPEDEEPADPEEPDPEEPTDPEEPEPGDGDGDEDDEPEPEPEPDEPTAPEWEQRYGHNPYNTGDRVTWEGSIYESAIDNNTYSPGEYPQGWAKVS